AAVENVAAFDFQLQLGPGGEPVLPGDRELRRGQHDLARDRIDPGDRVGVAALGGVQQVLGLVAELVQVGPGRQIRHDVSLAAARSAPGPEEIVTTWACGSKREVDSVLPADPAAPSSTGNRFYRRRTIAVTSREHHHGRV